MPRKKQNTIELSKIKMQDIIQKALGKTSKGEKPIIDEVMIYFTKKGVLYGEFIGMSAGNIGWFDKEYFDEYKIKTPSVVNFGDEHLNKMGYIRSVNVVLNIGAQSLTYLSPNGKEKYPVTFKKLKTYDEEDISPEEVHEEVKTFDIVDGDQTVKVIDLESTYDRSRLTEEDKKYNDEDEGYFVTYAYLRVPKTEFLFLPKSDSIIFRKKQQLEKGKKAYPAIELQTFVKLEQESGYKRVLSDIDFLKWHDPAGFEVRVDRGHFDKVVSSLGDMISIVFTQDYIMLSNVGEHYWAAYLIGYMAIDAAAIDIEDETGDLETDIKEVQKKPSDEEE